MSGAKLVAGLWAAAFSLATGNAVLARRRRARLPADPQASSSVAAAKDKPVNDDLSIVVRLLRTDGAVRARAVALCAAILARLLVSLRVSQQIGAMGSLLARRRWRALADAQISFALWTVPAALLNAGVDLCATRLALAAHRTLSDAALAQLAHREVLADASQTLPDWEQRASGDAELLATQLAALLQHLVKPAAEALVLTSALARMLGPRPLLACYAYFALAAGWARAVTPALTPAAAEAQRREGASRAAHARLAQRAEDALFADAAETEARILQEAQQQARAARGRLAAQRFMSSALDGYAVRYMGILAALLAMRPALAARASGVKVKDPTAFFLTSLHLLVNLMGAFKDVAEFFRARAAARGLAARVAPLLQLQRRVEAPAPLVLSEEPAPPLLLEFADASVGPPGAAEPVLCHVSMRVRAGQSVLLRGANGAGKTSLLRAARGIWRPSAGDVRLLTDDVMFLTHRPMLPAGRCSLRQLALYPWPQRPVPDDRLRWALQEAGMLRDGARLEDQVRVEDLSAGEQQRLACARVLARRPQLCLADECCSSCEAGFEEQFMSLCIEQLGVTMVTVSHRRSARLEELHARTLDL